ESANATVSIDVVDTSAPSVPAGLVASAVSTTQIELSWTASSDNVDVVGYRVFRGGTEIGTTEEARFTDDGLLPSTTYAYRISSSHAAGNESEPSAPKSTTTLAPELVEQGLRLDEGWNLVSLHVAPEDRSVEAVLASI